MRDEGTLYQISESEEGTFLMNAKDLRLIHHLKEIYDAGVCSFKVEGRTKSLNYVALVSQAYRQAIDDMCDNKDFNPKLMDDLEKVANRGYHTGFMIRENPGAQAQNYNTSVSRNFSQRFGGLIATNDEKSPEGYLPVDVRNKITLGQSCQVIFPDQSAHEFSVNEILDKNLNSVESAHGGAGRYYFKAPNINPKEFGILSLKVNSKEFHNIQ